MTGIIMGLSDEGVSDSFSLFSGSLMRDPVVMISLYPEFPEEVMSFLATQGEFVFVIDRSGSMGSMMNHGKGEQMRIESAKVRFNVCFLLC